ncbi:MFS general substrate transporter [Coprinopsis marcescibilis]|uniref:MFS general substrate transporter n=1 Tax=Coprinopsis marcescibilis TaxID=230819 RepID=A0A5C3L1Y7_COPMA|nr:MFS general substrate transporter [Coprinopsis marcescibilis]
MAKEEGIPGSGHKPIGLRWRASVWFTTLVVGSGIAIDLLVYSIIIPVIPFQLELIGYSDVSALSGWLLFAFSGGLLISTFPIAHVSEKYNDRRWLLIIGFIILIGSLVMMMEAPNYAVMCVARVLQGIGSSFLWVVGLALLADAVPEQLIGQQLGLAMMGMPLGMTLGPPLGGALYSRFGFRGPFVFGIVVSAVDLCGRILVIERKDSVQWGFDPHVLPSKGTKEATNFDDPESKERPAAGIDKVSDLSLSTLEPKEDGPIRKVSLVKTIWTLCKNRRALAAFLVTLVYGVLLSSMEPSVPVHLKEAWGLDSKSVGLVFIAAVVPTLISAPISGYITDKKGGEWVTLPSLLISIPWTGVLIIQGKLALFVVCFGILNFFLSGVVAPVTAELAIVSRNSPGIGYAHVYSAFNVAYGVGTTIGPVIGGQMYDRLPDGWDAVCILGISFLAAGSVVGFAFVGETPLLKRMVAVVKE